jgi:hypothetical protein
MTEWINVADVTPRIGYTATASQTAFVVPFVFFENSDLRVYQDEVLLTLDTDYTVTGAQDEDGGTVTLLTGATVGDAIRIARHVPIEQTTHIPPSGPLDIAAINIQISKLIAISQQLNDSFERSLRQPDSEDLLDMELPAARENKILGFDSNGAPVAVLGPSSVAAEFIGATLVESKAVAQVTDFDATTNYLLVGGDAAAGDAALTAYIQGTGTGDFTDGGGTSWKPVPGSGGGSGGGYGLITAVGDGVANDRVAIQATIDAVAAAGGGTVICTSGAIYRIVINGGAYDGLVLKDGVTLNVNNATINLECTGSVYGIRMQSNSHIVGPGTIKTTVSSSPGSSAWWHSPVVVGAAYGEVTDVGDLGDFINASNWSVRSVILDTVRTGAGGEIFAGVGGISHGLVEDVIIPNNSGVSIAIGLDHGTVGALDASDIPASRVLFDANLAYSVFPHDITIRRCKIGNMTKTPDGLGDGGFGVRLSGCYKIKVEDVEVASSSYCGFFHTAGDFGFEFAPTNAIKRRRYRGTTFKNCHVYDALNGYGFVCEAYADNIAAAISGSGYSPLLPAINNTDILFEGCRTICAAVSASALPGFYISNMIGGTLRNCFAFFHQYGAQLVNGVDQLLIDNCEFTSSYKDGIYVGDSDPPEDIRIVGARCYANGQDPGATLYAGIRVDAGTRTRVERCVLGISGEGSQDYGIRVTTSAVNATLIDNHVLGVATSGVGYSLASATSYGTVFLFRGNSAASGVTTVVGGLNIIPVEYIANPYAPYRRFITSRASVMTVTPAAGTWLAGDTIEFMDPLSGGNTGSKCTVAGSPGTWKNYGVIA